MIPEIKPKEAWDLLKKDGQALLIDVRTPEEWEQVGYPELSSLGKEVIKISLQDRMGNRNVNFIRELKKTVTQLDRPLLFLCFMGGRSRIAAILAKDEGYKNVYNIKEGFEGPANVNGVRGTIAGWLADNLPFTKKS